MAYVPPGAYISPQTFAPSEEYPSDPYASPDAYGPPDAYGLAPPFGATEANPAWSPPPGDPPLWGPGAASEPNGQRRILIIALVAAAVLLVAGVASAAVVLTGRHTHSAAPGGTSASPPPTSSKSGPPTFTSSGPTGTPSLSTFPSDTPNATPADQAAISANATAFYHALAASHPQTFCPLWDPVNLAAVLKVAKVPRCQDAALKNASDKTLDAAFSVDDPTQIAVDGTDAEIPASAISPTGFGGGNSVIMRKSSGVWKVVFQA